MSDQESKESSEMDEMCTTITKKWLEDYKRANFYDEGWPNTLSTKEQYTSSNSTQPTQTKKINQQNYEKKNQEAFQQTQKNELQKTNTPKKEKKK